MYAILGGRERRAARLIGVLLDRLTPWCRVSTDGQRELSLDSQELAVRKALDAQIAAMFTNSMI